MIKRAFDIVMSAGLLLVSSPLLVLIAIVIRLESRGPVIFRQTRSGKDGVPFDIWKFRTMVADADRLGPVITTAGDSRVTRVGAFLRRTKLDELPQLVNVLRGDMSFVGPRPEVPKYVALYTPVQRAVLTVRPGITGISQLEMRDEEAQLDGVEDIEAAYIQRLMPAKLRLDLDYIRDHSLWTDLSILVRTVFRLSDVPMERRGDKKRSVRRTLMRFRKIPIVIAQLVVVALCNYSAFLLRFDGTPPRRDLQLFWLALPWLILIRGLVFVPFRLYEGLWRYTGIYDLRMLVGGMLTSTLVFTAYVRGPFGPLGYSRSVILIDFVLVTVVLGGLRLLRRISTEVSVAGKSADRLLVYGAGGAGEMIVREIRQQPSFGFRPVGFIDDDPRKIGTSIHGVRVLGTSADLPKIVAKHRPSAFLIAVPTAAPERIRAIFEDLKPFDLPIKTLPKLQDMLEGRKKVSQIRTLAVEDLMARPPVGLDEAAVDGLVRGRRVMVTGAGGSIGSELCRQILKFKPSVLVLLERYENSLHAIRLELERGRARSGTKIVPVIGDVTDHGGLSAVFSQHRPELVFHAAAHKHVPLMEENPCEAVKNNVRGTRLVAENAEKWGVDRMIFISTDKAANPSSVMGASKQVAEQVVLAQAAGSGTSFSIVRFGNVLGSNGSVVPMFLEQISRGGPVTVTDPEVKRYFMLIPEAVSLVLHAAAHAHSGGTYVLDMGEQIKIIDLAKNLIRQAGLVPDEDIKIVFSGLRPGEKLAEELVSSGERLVPSEVASVSQVVRPGPGPDLAARVRHLEDLAASGSADRVVAELQALSSIEKELAETADDETDEALSAGAARIPCPNCATGSLMRSRSRTRSERVKKRLTSRRLFRCDACGWRDWIEQIEMSEPSQVLQQSPIDLSALDDGTSELSRSTAAPSVAPVRRRGFSPRDL
jgi:FlaA1/EpsC-like NDP-sugar epimerase/lipopolysaccharide/colanic/teichoic acid biosynthesis glycosyltransferase